MTDELKPLSKKHKAFAEHYLKCFNGTQAYLLVYPKSSYESARSTASELLTKPNVKAYIDDRLSAIQMSADEALALLAEHARGDMGAFMDISSVGYSLDLEAAQKKGMTKLIKEIEQKVVTINGKDEDKEIITTKIKLHDPQAAAEKILRVLGKFTDHVDVTTGGEPLIVRIIKASDGTDNKDK